MYLKLIVMSALYSILPFSKCYLINSDSIIEKKDSHRPEYEFWVYQLICPMILNSSLDFLSLNFFIHKMLVNLKEAM